MVHGWYRVAAVYLSGVLAGINFMIFWILITVREMKNGSFHTGAGKPVFVDVHVNVNLIMKTPRQVLLKLFYLFVVQKYISRN
jgi:hypothetical protein